jgi:non-homologous end joining protein Ku
VIREAIRKEGMVGLARVVFTSREHVIALEARDKGLLGITLRYPYEAPAIPNSVHVSSSRFIGTIGAWKVLFS